MTAPTPVQSSERPGFGTQRVAHVSSPALPGEVHVWRVPLECAPREIGHLNGLLNTGERERASRFVFPRDRDHFIAARGRLRLLLGQYLRADPAALDFRYGHAGKPQLEGSDFPFSVSHSAGLALIALGGPGRLGVDVERIRPRRNPDSFRHVLAPAEEAAIDALAPELRERAFFACWTRKEAYLKGRGDGLGFGLDRFEVSVRPDSPAKLLRVPGDPDETLRWELHSLDFEPEYAAALAIEGHGCVLLCFDWGIDQKGAAV